MSEIAQQERHVRHLPCVLESFSEGSIFFLLSDTIQMIQIGRTGPFPALPAP